jgi:hypothetical protein
MANGERISLSESRLSECQAALAPANTEAKGCNYDFAALIRDDDPTASWTEYPRQFITDDLFTHDEKAAIEVYPSTHHFPGISCNATRQTFPIPNHWAPCHAAGYGSWVGEYMFDREAGCHTSES